ncbi:hypothetical protein HK405_015632, partial [Cladochytrium tenue]
PSIYRPSDLPSAVKRGNNSSSPEHHGRRSATAASRSPFTDENLASGDDGAENDGAYQNDGYASDGFEQYDDDGFEDFEPSRPASAAAARTTRPSSSASGMGAAVWSGARHGEAKQRQPQIVEADDTDNGRGERSSSDEDDREQDRARRRAARTLQDRAIAIKMARRAKDLRSLIQLEPMPRARELLDVPPGAVVSGAYAKALAAGALAETATQHGGAGEAVSTADGQTDDWDVQDRWTQAPADPRLPADAAPADPVHLPWALVDLQDDGGDGGDDGAAAGSGTGARAKGRAQKRSVRALLQRLGRRHGATGGAGGASTGMMPAGDWRRLNSFVLKASQ